MHNTSLIDFPKKPIASYQIKNVISKSKLTYKDIYDNYIKHCVIKNIRPAFTSLEYKTFTEFFNKYFIDVIIKTGKLYELPFSLGVMGMLKKKSKLKVPNWQK
jgi:hypothetical protein